MAGVRFEDVDLLGALSRIVDLHRIFMGPEESMQIQSHLASTIAMAFDE